MCIKNDLELFILAMCVKNDSELFILVLCKMIRYYIIFLYKHCVWKNDSVLFFFITFHLSVAYEKNDSVLHYIFLYKSCVWKHDSVLYLSWFWGNLVLFHFQAHFWQNLIYSVFFLVNFISETSYLFKLFFKTDSCCYL